MGLRAAARQIQDPLGISVKDWTQNPMQCITPGACFHPSVCALHIFLLSSDCSKMTIWTVVLNAFLSFHALHTRSPQFMLALLLSWVPFQVSDKVLMPGRLKRKLKFR